MAQFATNFSEYPNDLQPSDWSRPWSSGRYVVRAQPSPIPGGKLLRKETGSFHDVILWDTVGVAAEAEFLALVRFVSGENIQAAGSLRAQPPGRTHIEPGIVFGTEARIFLLVNNSSQGSISASYSYAPNTWHWIRARASGPVVQLKAWPHGQPEPSGWSVQLTSLPAVLQNPGKVGLYSFSGSLFDCAWFSVGTNGDTAPGPDENHPPNTPTGSVGEVTQTTAQLLSSPFSDPDGDVHAASQWRIYRADDGTLVLDSGETTTDLTSFLATGLAPETAYEFEVRHKDDSGNWSEWSVRVAFETAAIVGWRPCPAPPATVWQPCGLFTPGVLGRFWKRPTEALAMVVDDSLPPDEMGVFDRIEFSNLAPGGQATNWNVRYLATLIPPATRDYRFRIFHDDGVRIWINGVLVFESWIVQDFLTQFSGPIRLVQGRRYRFQLDYFEGPGPNGLRLEWDRAAPGVYEPITDAYLFLPPVPIWEDCSAVLTTSWERC